MEERPPEPCQGCNVSWRCKVKERVNELAVEAYIKNEVYECPCFTPEIKYERGGIVDG